MISELRSVALTVPDPSLGVPFYRDFGLSTHDHAEYVGMQCRGTDTEQVLLLPGREKRVHHLRFAALPEGFSLIKDKLEKRNVALLDPPYPGASGGIWFKDPDDYLVNVDTTTQLPARDPMQLITGLGGRTAPDPEPLRVAVPQRLSHCILFSSDTERQASFYTDVMGMRVSDRFVGGLAVFLRTSYESDHHVLAFAKSDRPGLHHMCFMVPGLDDLMFGSLKMKEKGYRHVWGPGRHVVGSNYFHYFRDPWGSMIEYSFDIDVIAADKEWEPRIWEKSGIALWSHDGHLPADFFQNFETQ